MKKFIILLLTLLCISSISYADEIKVTIDNLPIEFDVAPTIIENRTMVPMRKIFEELGCTVEWLGETQTIIAAHNSKLIALQIGNPRVLITDIETGVTDMKLSDISPIIIDNRTLVPLRIISESLGHNVDWIGSESHAVITTN